MSIVQSGALFRRERVKKGLQRGLFAIFAHPDNPTGQVVQHDGHVTMALLDGDFVHRLHAQTGKPRLGELLFEKRLVDVAHGFLVPSDMPRRVEQTHLFSKVVDVLRHARRNSFVSIARLDHDASARGTVDFPQTAVEHDAAVGQIKIAHGPLVPRVDGRANGAATRTPRGGARVRSKAQAQVVLIGQVGVRGDFHSTKSAEGCYGNFGHRLFPGDMSVFANSFIPRKSADVLCFFAP